MEADAVSLEVQAVSGIRSLSSPSSLSHLAESNTEDLKYQAKLAECNLRVCHRLNAEDTVVWTEIRVIGAEKQDSQGT